MKIVMCIRKVICMKHVKKVIEKNKKMFKILCVMVFLLNSNISYADDYIEDEPIDFSSDEILQTSGDSDDIVINSRIAVAYDRDSGRVVWGKNENKKTAMASTTKIMTALVVIENANLDDVVEVSQKSAGTGGSRLGLKKSDKVSVRDLLYGLMLRSGNDAAVALAEYVGGSVENFANLMNDKARALNLKDTHFVTPHGLDDPEHYTTAYELAQIADYALENEIFSKIVGTKSYTITINGYPKSLNNTNELLGYLDGVYGVKTGFTNNAGRCLVTSVKKADMDIITVVIQADTKKDRTKDSIKIINYIFNNYVKVNVEEFVDNEFSNWKEINLGRINVSKAKDCTINLIKDEVKNKIILVKKDESDYIRAEINGIFEYESPVEKNTKFGEIKIFLNDELLEHEDIFFESTIYKKDVWDYFYQCVNAITI